MNRIITVLAGFAALLAGGEALAAAAPAVTSQDPGSIVGVLQDAGYKAELSRDANGDPIIRSASSGSRFSILFYGCEDGKQCTSIQFYAGWTKATNCSLESMNTFSRKYRFVTPMIDDENDCVIQYDVNVDKGGISPELFKDTLEVWTSTMANFEEYIFAKPKSGDGETVPK